MNIYKLHYNNKAQGDADLLLKGVYEIITDLETTQEVYNNTTLVQMRFFQRNCVHGFLGHNNSSRVKEIE
jgi:hypothetical protein